MPILRRSRRFAAHVLSEAAAETADLFARGSAEARRAALRARADAAPEPSGWIVRLDMSVDNEIASGDHQIVIGRVFHLEDRSRVTETAPLTWWRGRLGALAPR